VAFLGDLAVALSMEAVAPTKVDIGPGEKTFVRDMPPERATVISGFDTSEHGQVSIRGESWQAVRALDDTGILSKGTAVHVVERRGLTLVVSAKAS
jgi:membrane protein implicated in regulation of membrane protease activity